MLAAFTAAIFAFSPPDPTFTVEFRVLRVPAGRGEHLIQTDPNRSGLYSVFVHWRRVTVLSGDSFPLDLSDDSNLIDAGGLPGHDPRHAPWVRKAELSGPKLRAGRTPMTERMTLPLWDIVTRNEERISPFACVSTRADSREVLVSHATFTASAVPATDGRIELRVSYAEGELPPAKEPALPLSPDLAPFYATEAPVPQPITSTFWLPPVVNRTTNATANAALLPGQKLVFFVGRCTSRSTQPWLASRADNLCRRQQAIEDDVIVFATVRK